MEQDTYQHGPATERHGHGSAVAAVTVGHDHAGMIAEYRRRFSISAVLTLPILAMSHGFWELRLGDAGTLCRCRHRGLRAFQHRLFLRRVARHLPQDGGESALGYNAVAMPLAAGAAAAWDGGNARPLCRSNPLRVKRIDRKNGEDE